MLSIAKEKWIASLQTKKGREKHERCLVEGPHAVEMAKDYIDFVFSRDDTERFDQLVTTKTPQEFAAVSRIPQFTKQDIESRNIIVVLDGVQDPGNVGTILRLCLGFDASLVLVESCDVTNPKVIRSSVGSLFRVPWMTVARDEATTVVTSLRRQIVRLEKTQNAGRPLTELPDAFVLIVGSEGNGITLDIEGQSLSIDHNSALESLNVASALTIVLHHQFSQSSAQQN